MKKTATLLAVLLIVALCLGAACALEGEYPWKEWTVEVTKLEENPMLVPAGMAGDEYAVSVYLTVDEALWQDKDLCVELYAQARLADAQRNAYQPGAMMAGSDKPFLIFTFCVPQSVSAEELSFVLGEGSPEASDAVDAGEAVFTWKGYSMTFPCMTADLAEYGLESFHGAMVLVRLAATDGTFAYRDFRQNLFELVDSDGNAHPCKFFVPANTDDSNPAVKGLPGDQQEYIDMLFEMSDAAAEKLAAAHVNVYEEKGGQPVEVPLKSVPQTVEK